MPPADETRSLRPLLLKLALAGSASSVLLAAVVAGVQGFLFAVALIVALWGLAAGAWARSGVPSAFVVGVVVVGVVAGMVLLAPAASAHTPEISRVSNVPAEECLNDVRGEEWLHLVVFCSGGKVWVQDGTSSAFFSEDVTTTTAAFRSGCVYGLAPDRLIIATDDAGEVHVGIEGPDGGAFTWSQNATSTLATVHTHVCFSAEETWAFAGSGSGVCLVYNVTSDTSSACPGAGSIGSTTQGSWGLAEDVTGTGATDSRVWIVRSTKTEAEYDGGWTDFGPHTNEIENEIWCAQIDVCMTVGQNGQVAFYNGTAFAFDTLPSGAAFDVHGIVGRNGHAEGQLNASSEDAYAVGQDAAGAAGEQVALWHGGTQGWHFVGDDGDLLSQAADRALMAWCDGVRCVWPVRDAGGGTSSVYTWVETGANATATPGVASAVSEVRVSYGQNETGGDNFTVFVRDVDSQVQRFNATLATVGGVVNACALTGSQAPNLADLFDVGPEGTAITACSEGSSLRQMRLTADLALDTSFLVSDLRHVDIYQEDSVYGTRVENDRVDRWDPDQQALIWSFLVGEDPAGLGVDRGDGTVWTTTQASGTFHLSRDQAEPQAVVPSTLLSSSVNGRAIAARDPNVFIGSASGTLAKYLDTGTSLNLLSELTLSGNVALNGVRMTKDGRYLMAWSGPTLHLIEASSNTELTSFELGTSVVSADMDCLNNRLYATDGTDLFLFNVWTFTTGNGGDGGDDPNPAAATNSCDDAADDDDPGIIAPSQAAGASGDTGTLPTAETFLGVSLVDVGTSMGASTGAAAWFVGLLLILAITAGLWMATRSNVVTGLAAVGSTGMSVAFGLIPAWFIALLFALSAVVVVMRMRAPGV